MTTMTTPNHHLSLPSGFNSESVDPCSLTYQRYYQRTSAMPRSTSVRGKHGRGGIGKSKTRTIAKVAQWVKKAFRSKSKRGFVMPHEYAKLHGSASRSSVRSHRSSGSMRMTNPKRASAPPVLAIRPSTKARNVSYRVHSHEGSPSTSKPAKDNVRFSHPTVKDVRLRPRTPSLPLDAHLDVMDVDDRCSIQTSTTADAQTGSNGHNFAAGPPLNPKAVYSQSDNFKNPDGKQISFDEFKARLDGHKFQSAFGARSFRPSMQDIDMDIDILGPQSPDIGPVDIRKNRDKALSLLEAGPMDMLHESAPVLSSQYPALVPGQHPASLIPGPRPDAGAAKLRPNSYPPTSAPKPVFKAYSPDDYQFFNDVSKYGHDSRSPPQQEELTPAEKQRKAESDARNREIAALEARAMRPLADFIAEAQDRHHHERVEAGPSSYPRVPIAPPPTPLPSTASSSRSGGSGKSKKSFLNRLLPAHEDRGDAYLSDYARSKMGQNGGVAQGPTLHRSPLPPTPAPTPPPSKTVPSPHKMNDNGYPVQNLRGAATRYSADPSYQHRSVNEVEAKFLREQKAANNITQAEDRRLAKLGKERAKIEAEMAKTQAKKAKKEAEKAAKIAKEEEAKAAKIAKKQKKKAEKSELVEKQKQMDGAVKKLMF